MRTLLLAAVLVPTLAQADTPVTLYGEHCTNTAICFDVQNDGGLVINYLQLSCGAGCISISLNGVRYSSGLNAADNLPHDGVISFQGVPAYADDGSAVYVSVDASYHTKPCGGGRAHYYCHLYDLLDGMVVLP